MCTGAETSKEVMASFLWLEPLAGVQILITRLCGCACVPLYKILSVATMKRSFPRAKIRRARLWAPKVFRDTGNADVLTNVQKPRSSGAASCAASSTTNSTVVMNCHVRKFLGALENIPEFLHPFAPLLSLLLLLLLLLRGVCNCVTLCLFVCACVRGRCVPACARWHLLAVSDIPFLRQSPQMRCSSKRFCQPPIHHRSNYLKDQKISEIRAR